MEIVPPKRTGKKAVAIMKIDVLVEIEETDAYYDMVEQAEVKLRKHVVEGKGFFPFRSQVDTVEDGITVSELVQKLTIQPRKGW